MRIGGFTFEFPVWIIHSEIGAGHGFACCEVEGQDCLSVFTDEALIQSYVEKHTVPGRVTPVRLDSPTALADSLEQALATDLATHIAFDPVPKAFVWPIVEAAEIPRMNE